MVYESYDVVDAKYYHHFDAHLYFRHHAYEM
jgi:hypothetical protein